MGPSLASAACRAPALVASLTILAAGAVPGVGAEPDATPAGEPFAAIDLHLGVAASVPAGELANEDPRHGWFGGQGTGLAASAGVRIAITRDVYLRPELTYHRFRAFETEEPFIAFDGFDSDTISTDWSRQVWFTGLQLAVDYIPASSSGITPFLWGGLGLLYLRYEDDIRFLDGTRTTPHEGATAMSVRGGVGVVLRRFEIDLSLGLQEPSFGIVGRTSWYSVDLGVATTIPLH
jgi:hypothetical protein